MSAKSLVSTVAVVVIVVATGVPVVAQSRPTPRVFVGDETVAEWRRNESLLGEKFAVGYASGALSAMGAFVECTDPLTVGELIAFLRHGADPTWTVRDALAFSLIRQECRQRSRAGGRS